MVVARKAPARAASARAPEAPAGKAAARKKPARKTAARPQVFNAPESAGLAADARLRGTAVKLAAAVRSGGVTTAITNAVRVGTSICDSALHSNNSASAANPAATAKAPTARSMQQGRRARVWR